MIQVIPDLSSVFLDARYAIVHKNPFQNAYVVDLDGYVPFLSFRVRLPAGQQKEGGTSSQPTHRTVKSQSKRRREGNNGFPGRGEKSLRIWIHVSICAQ